MKLKPVIIHLLNGLTFIGKIGNLDAISTDYTLLVDDVVQLIEEPTPQGMRSKFMPYMYGTSIEFITRNISHCCTNIDSKMLSNYEGILQQISAARSGISLHSNIPTGARPADSGMREPSGIV